MCVYRLRLAWWEEVQFSRKGAAFLGVVVPENSRYVRFVFIVAVGFVLEEVLSDGGYAGGGGCEEGGEVG